MPGGISATPADYAASALRHQLRSQFTALLREHGAASLSLLGTELDFWAERDEYRLIARFNRYDIATDSSNELMFTVILHLELLFENSRRLRTIAQVREGLIRLSQDEWNRAYEDDYVRRQTEQSRLAMEAAHREGRFEEYRALSYRYQQELQHARQHHAEPYDSQFGLAAQQALGQLGQGAANSGLHNGLSGLGSQINARQRAAMAQYQAQARQQIDVLYGYTQMRPGEWPSADPAVEKAGIRLLRQNLTAVQLEQYDIDRTFIVHGSAGGKYRIKQGRQMNIDRLDSRGARKGGLCFLPIGGLCEGDCMLAQKIKLETDEPGALKIGNKFS